MSELWEVFGSYTVVPQPSWRLSNHNPAHFPSGDWHTLPLTFMVFHAAFSVCAPPIGNQVRYFTNLLKMVFMKYGFTSKGQEYSCMLEYRQGSATSSPYHQCWKILKWNCFSKWKVHCIAVSWSHICPSEAFTCLLTVGYQEHIRMGGLSKSM